MSRRVTPEERALWRESNRFTKKTRQNEVEKDAPAAFAEGEIETKAKPRSTEAHAHARPLPLPRKGVALLTALPVREAKKRFASYPVEATLDLHGFNKLEAYARVALFLRSAAAAGKRHVTIITGKGRNEPGLLRREVPHWLNEPGLRPLISAFTQARPRAGGDGVLHVLMKA